MRVCLFEDPSVALLEPLTLTRPAFNLLCGPSSLRTKHLHYFAPDAWGVLIRPHLEDWFRWRHPGKPVNDFAWLAAGPAVLVNARWLPPGGKAPPDLAQALPSSGVAIAGHIALVNKEVAYVLVGRDRLARLAAAGLESWLEECKATLPAVGAGGRIVRYPWDLIEQNATFLNQELECIQGPRGAPAGVALLGPAEGLCIHSGARVEPMAVFDTTTGPIYIDRDALVTAFSRIEGPCYVGVRSQILGARLRGGVTIGPNCRIGGEVEASIVQGHSNKYHDGFLGHSYLGEWINLGAGTHTSDLRNDYGEIAVTVNGQPVSTGLSKVGSLMGDHTKTGLGVLLNTGSSIGAFCNLLPSGSLLPKHIPSFCTWWNGQLRESGDLQTALRVAGKVMKRRGSELTQAHQHNYESVFGLTNVERRKALVKSECRQLRRTA